VEPRIQASLSYTTGALFYIGGLVGKLECTLKMGRVTIGSHKRGICARKSRSCMVRFTKYKLVRL